MQRLERRENAGWLARRRDRNDKGREGHVEVDRKIRYPLLLLLSVEIEGSEPRFTRRGRVLFPQWHKFVERPLSMWGVEGRKGEHHPSTQSTRSVFSRAPCSNFEPAPPNLVLKSNSANNF